MLGEKSLLASAWRRVALAGTESAWAQVTTIHLRLLQIGAQVRVISAAGFLLASSGTTALLTGGGARPD